MMSAPKISILVPIFNVEKYLRECLDSIVNQSLSDIEIICINDGSTDTSLDIIKEYAKKDSRIVIINKKNSGYGDSMNKGLEKATGDYIGIVESDDFVDPAMFSDLYNLAVRHSADAVKSNFYNYYTSLSEDSPQWDAEIGAIYDKASDQIVKKHDVLCKIINDNEIDKALNPQENTGIFWQKPAIWAGIYKRDFLTENKIRFLPSPGASYQDTGFNFKVWASATRVAFSDKAYLHYRQDNEASSVNNPGKVFCIAEEFEEIEKFLKQKNLYLTLGALMQVAKFGAYTWNYWRLEEKLARDFLDRFSDEFKRADSDGSLNMSLFGANQQRQLNEILENPKMYAKRRRAQSRAKISIIVPIYNVQSHLEDSLRSLANQSLKDIEIICVNDGSTDGSIFIIEDFYKKDPRFVIVDKLNGGQSTARNAGLRYAHAPTIAFCDGDDRFAEDACEKMLAAQKESEADIVIAEIKVIYNDPSQVGTYKKSDEAYYRLRYRGLIEVSGTVIENTDSSVCNKLFKTSVIRRYNLWFPNGLWYEDASFVYRYMLISTTAYYMKGYISYNYFRRTESTMAETAVKNVKAIDHIRIGFRLFHFMKENDILKAQSTFFIRVMKSFYDLTLKYVPENYEDEVNSLMWGFLKANKPYMESIDTSIAKSIEAILPEQAKQKRISIQRVKRAIKKHSHRILRKASPTYQQQEKILIELKSLSAKVEYLDKSTRTANTSLRQHIKDIERKIDRG